MEESFKNNRVVMFDKFGGPEVLKIHNLEIPEVKGTLIRIKISSISLNRADQLYRCGVFIDSPKNYPASFGSECSGVVDAIGDEVPKGRFKLGDSVSVLPCNKQSEYPSYGEYALFPYQSVILNPVGMSHNDSSSIWLAYLTAYYAFNDITSLVENDYIVITAPSSSASLAAIQLAKLSYKVKVIVISRTSEKKELLKGFNVDHFISLQDNNVESLDSIIRDITGEKGVSLVYDCIGGPIVNSLSKTLKKHGTYILYGMLDPTPTVFPLVISFINYINFKGYIVYEFTNDLKKLERGTSFLLEQFSIYEFRSIVGKIFKGIESVIDGHQYLEKYNLFGKTVIEI